jgi:RHS repeat-associated protein
MVLFAMYPAGGGTVVVSTAYDSQGNVISNIFTILDADGKITETIDMLAYQAQQELEQKQQAFLESLSASRTLDDDGMTMMAMSSPESPAVASEIFHYDHLGNRYQSVDKYGFVSTYTHNPVNQYQQAVMALPFVPDQVTTFSHDDNGNLSEDGQGYSYAYDYRNRLAKVEDYESSIVAEYAFDALGRRISKTVNGKKTYFIYDSQGRVIAEYEQDALKREFVYGNRINEVVAMFLPKNEGNPEDWDAFIEFVESWLCIDPNDVCYNAAYDHNSDDIVNYADFAHFANVWDMPSNNETLFYYLHDALGSVRGLIGGRFNREEDREFYNYDVYGNSTDASSVGNPFRFAGYWYDAETGLYHTPFRTYDSQTGRWLQIDPKGYIDGMNLYEYVRSNPVKYTDPFGLSTIYWTPGGVGFPVEYQKITVNPPCPSESAVQLRQNAINALQDFANTHKKYDYYSLTGLQGLVENKLIPAIKWLSAEDYGSLAKGNDPQYSTYWGFRKLSLPEILSSTKIFHEAIHVYNDMSSWYMGNRKDEGMAYAAQQMEVQTQALRNIEYQLAQESPNKTTLQKSWQSFWGRVNNVIGTSGQYYIANVPINFQINESDVSMVGSRLGFKYSCSQLANHYNSRLKDNKNIKCARFVCELHTNRPDSDITVSDKLYPIFK